MEWQINDRNKLFSVMDHSGRYIFLIMLVTMNSWQQMVLLRGMTGFTAPKRILVLVRLKTVQLGMPQS